MITLLLDKGLDIEHEGQFGTPLRSASLLGHESTVSLLLDHAAKASAGSSIGNALEAAAMNGHVSIANSLLKKGVDANSKGGSYGTALQAAAYRGHSKIAELLLDAGADVYLPGISKDAFHAAAEGGHENVIRLLLNREFTFRQPLDTLARRKHRMAQSSYKNLLRSSSLDYRTQNNRRNIRRKKPESSKDLSTFYYKKYNRKDYALQVAASNGHHGIVELIMDNLAEHGAQYGPRRSASRYTRLHGIVTKMSSNAFSVESSM